MHFIVGANILTFNIPRLAHQRCLPRWGPLRTLLFSILQRFAKCNESVYTIELCVTKNYFNDTTIFRQNINFYGTVICLFSEEKYGQPET